MPTVTTPGGLATEPGLLEVEVGRGVVVGAMSKNVPYRCGAAPPEMMGASPKARLLGLSFVTSSAFGTKWTGFCGSLRDIR